MLDRWISAIGTRSKKFTLGFKNLILDASSGILRITNSSGTLVRIQAAVPSASSDVVTKGYLDIHTDHYDVYKASVAITGGRAVAMSASGLIYLTADNIKSFVGVSKSSVAANANCTVSLGPVVGGFSNISTGSIYYLGASGAITTTPSNTVIGVGVSSSEIKLNVHRDDTVHYVTS